MSRTQEDLLALKAELTNDPLGLGLTVLPEDDAANADKLNAVMPTILLERSLVPPTEIRRAIVRTEYNAAVLADRQWIDLILGGDGGVDTRSGTETRTGLLAIFAAGTKTRTNLSALLTVAGNRIDQMFQQGLLSAGGSVTPSDISQARNAV